MGTITDIVGPSIADSVKQSLDGDQDVTIVVRSINGLVPSGSGSFTSGSGSFTTRRLVSRGLEDSLSVDFDIVLAVTCATSVCSEITTQETDVFVESVETSFQAQVQTGAL